MQLPEHINTHLLYEISDVVDAIFHYNWLLGLQRLAFGFSLGLVQKTFLLGSLVLGAILQQQLEQAGSWTCDPQFRSGFVLKIAFSNLRFRTVT